MNYYVVATRVNLGGFPESYSVGYDNKATYDFDNLMFFETEQEALDWTKTSAAAEWVGCTFQVCKVESVE